MRSEDPALTISLSAGIRLSLSYSFLSGNPIRSRLGDAQAEIASTSFRGLAGMAGLYASAELGLDNLGKPRCY